MSDGSFAEAAVPCPHCYALNAVNAAVCRSCGVNVSALRNLRASVATSENDAAKEPETNDTAAVLDTPTSSAALEQNRQRLMSQLCTLFVVSSCAAVMILIGSLLYAQHLRVRRAQQAQRYQQALQCITQRDYLCARDAFTALLAEDSSYPGARERLQDARYEIASQDLISGHWQKAIAEGDAMLKADQADGRANVLINQAFDGWYKEAVDQGDWATAVRVSLQRRAYAR